MRGPSASAATIPVMGLEPQQFPLLQVLVRRDAMLRAKGCSLDFMLLQMSGSSVGFKPSADGDAEPARREAVLYVLGERGFVRALGP